MIVGEGAGYIYFYSRNVDGSLHAEGHILVNGTPLFYNKKCSPEIVDWNEDGLLDLLIGVAGNSDNESKPIRLYLNRGTKQAYSYSDYTTLKSGNTTIEHLEPRLMVSDLNMDGKKDLLIGERVGQNGMVQYYENIGTNEVPKFGSSVVVKSKGRDITFEAWGFRGCVDDWNNDGVPDLILGLGSTYQGSENGEFIHCYFGNDGTSTTTNIAGKVKNGLVQQCHYVPDCQNIVIEFSQKTNHNITFDLMTTKGQSVLCSSSYKIQTSDKGVSISVKDITTGMYLLNIKWKGLESTKRVLIHK